MGYVQVASWLTSWSTSASLNSQPSLAAGEVGGYSLLSVDVAEVEVVEGDPCEAGDWESCTIGGQPLVVVAAAVVGVGVVLLAVLCKACCKKKAKEGMQGGATTSDYAQWN